VAKILAMSSNAPEQQAVVVAKAASHAEVATVLADGQSAQANAQTGAKIRPASPPSAAKARKGKAKVGDKREEPTDVQRAQIAMRAAIKIQQIHRGKRGREASHAIKAVKQAEVDEVKEQGLLIKGQRVQPWSEESANMAMMELNGKIGTNGNVLWPKGTVEKRQGSRGGAHSAQVDCRPGGRDADWVWHRPYISPGCALAQVRHAGESH
jgi:hypothetical protein